MDTHTGFIEVNDKQNVLLAFIKKPNPKFKHMTGEKVCGACGVFVVLTVCVLLPPTLTGVYI